MKHNVLSDDIYLYIRIRQKTSTCAHLLPMAIAIVPRFTHSAPPLNSLHWLPLGYRNIVMICTRTHQAQSECLHSTLIPAKRLSSFVYQILIFFLLPILDLGNFSVSASPLWKLFPDDVKFPKDVSRKTIVKERCEKDRRIVNVPGSLSHCKPTWAI